MHRRRRRFRPAAPTVVAALVCGWWVTSLTPFSSEATVAVLAFGAVEIVVADAIRRRRRIVRAGAGAGAGGPDVPARAYLVWVVAAVVLAAWELFSLFSHPRSAHPTVSSMLDPLLASHPVRWLAFVAWARLGWELAT